MARSNSSRLSSKDRLLGEVPSHRVSRIGDVAAESQVHRTINQGARLRAATVSDECRRLASNVRSPGADQTAHGSAPSDAPTGGGLLVSSIQKLLS